MKKQKTLLIVVLIVAIAMVGLYLAMGIISGQKKETGDDARTIAMLTEMEDVTYVQYKNVEGMVTLIKTDGAWKCEENAELELVDAYIDEKVAELGKIEGTLVEDVKKADCGLETPAYALTVKNAEKEVKLVLGVNEEGYCYAMLDGKNEIYEIKEDVIEILNMSADSFAEPDGDVYSYLQDESDETLVEDDELAGDDTVEEIIPEEVTEDTTTEESTSEETPEAVEEVVDNDTDAETIAEFVYADGKFSTGSEIAAGEYLKTIQ